MSSDNGWAVPEVSPGAGGWPGVGPWAQSQEQIQLLKTGWELLPMALHLHPAICFSIISLLVGDLFSALWEERACKIDSPPTAPALYPLTNF